MGDILLGLAVVLLLSAGLFALGFCRASDADSRYEQEWGWTPGVPHTVVFFGFTDEEMV